MSYDYFADLISKMDDATFTSLKKEERWREVVGIVFNTDINSNAIIKNINESYTFSDQSERLAIIIEYLDVSSNSETYKAENIINELCRLEQNRYRIKLPDNITEQYKKLIIKTIIPALRANWLTQRQTAKNFEYYPIRKSFAQELENNISSLPDKSFLSQSVHIQFHFTLKEPWYSGNDQGIGVVENACSKDKLTGKPFLRASTIKGHLLNSIKCGFHLKNIDSVRIDDLFGSALDNRGNSHNGKQGRLIFYPTFFSKLDGENIAPHKRESGTVDKPIFYEVVPKDTPGSIEILYFPFDLVGKADSVIQVKKDLHFILPAMKALIEDFGVSAKKTSNWGVGLVDKVVVSSKKEIGKEFPISNTNMWNSIVLYISNLFEVGEQQ